MSSPAAFDVYGYRFDIQGDCPWALEGLADDFAAFRSSDNTAEVHLEVARLSPDFSSLPSLNASTYTPRNVGYKDGSTTYLDFHGRGLAVHDRQANSFCVVSEDEHLLYEACYLFLLAHISEALDRRGLHRVHALAVSVGGRASLVLLPMGGGKSTLGAALLSDSRVKLLSDDSPFIDRRGRVYPFPLHLGLLPGGETSIPADQLRKINRMEFGPKLLVKYDYYADQVGDIADPGFVFLGRRRLTDGCEIERASRLAGLRAMVENCVVGMGLFHGLEYLFQRSPMQLAEKGPIAFSRLRAANRLLGSSQVFHLTLGRSTETNASTLLDAIA